MGALVFLKPIFDMFYAYQVLDYALLLLSIVLFLMALQRIGRHVYSIDLCVLLIMGTLTGTFLRTASGFSVYVKMVSAYMMYFIGRGFFAGKEKCKRYLLISQIIVICANFAWFAMGKGFVIWGNANTFKGLYFYKTDLAIAMVQALCTVLYFARGWGVRFATICATASMIVLSNSRAAIIIFLMVLLLYALYKWEHITGKRLIVDTKLILGGGTAVFAMLLLTVGILSLPIFDSRDFITFDLKNLFSTSNLQGRDNVWAGILTKFNAANTFEKFFGIDFVSDVWTSLKEETFDSHNSYIKIMYSTGYVGLSLFVLFAILYIRRLNKVNDRSLSYFSLTCSAVFLLQSISQASIAFTQMTWIWMLFVGISVSESVNSSALHDREK